MLPALSYPGDVAWCIQGCSGEAGKWVLPPATGWCCLEQGWEETPTAVWAQVPPHPLSPSLRYRWRLGAGGQGASGVTLDTCRRQLAGLSSETHNFSVLRAPTCQENTSPVASSSCFLLSAPHGHSWPSPFSCAHWEDPSARVTPPPTAPASASGARAPGELSLHSGQGHPRPASPGAVWFPIVPSPQRGSMNCLFKK